MGQVLSDYPERKMGQKSPIILEALPVFNLSSTAWDDIAKYCGLDGLNKNHFLTVMEAGKPKTKVLADSILGEDSLPVLKTGRQLPSCTAFLFMDVERLLSLPCFT